MPAKSNNKKITRHNTNSVRIIAGDWRGRKLSFPDIPGLRPTGDRMRETLFNWLAPYIYECRVLDLFAGSGVLGMEAISRGAKSCIFVEIEPAAMQSLSENLEKMNCAKGRVVRQSAFDALNEIAPHSINLLFLDPPFDAQLHQPIIESLGDHQILTKSALVYVEAPKNELIQMPAGWSLLKEKISGEVRYSLYQTAAE
jgi:16S rRNA (guanine966-N2)-methyltransferase